MLRPLRSRQERGSLYNLITQDIDHRQGAALTDTHVDLFTHTLDYLIESGVPPQDVIIEDPCYKPEELGVVQIAMLETGEGEIPYEAVDGFVSSCKAIFKDGLMERGLDVLRNCALTCQELDLAITEIPLLLTDKDFRQAAVSQLTNFDVIMFWEQFERYRPHEFAQFVESTRNKISAVLLNPFLKPMLSATRSSVDFASAMNSVTYNLRNFSRDHLQPISRGLMASLRNQKDAQVVLQRQRIPESQRRPYTFYLDEAHEYFSPATLTLLSVTVLS